MTVRELEEQSGECVPIDGPYAGANGATLKLSVFANDVWLQWQRPNGDWESLRPATPDDVRAAATADQRIG